MLYSMNYEQHVTASTHQSGHTLDVVITINCEDIVEDLVVSDMVSDHNLVICRLKQPKPTHMRESVRIRKLRNVNLSQMQKTVATAVLDVPTEDEV